MKPLLIVAYLSLKPSNSLLTKNGDRATLNCVLSYADKGSCTGVIQKPVS